MTPALRTLWNLCLLRAKPQDLPYSFALLTLALGAHAVADVLPLAARVGVAGAVQLALLDTVLLVAVVHTGLLLRNRAARAVQTLSAVAGSGALLGLAAAAAVSVLGDLTGPLAVWLPFVLWYLAVFGHIVRHALDIPLLAATGLGVLYLILAAGLSEVVVELPTAAVS